jgi:CelD/BcsL family acetyltransferase involved in cellulose biosynthesis
MRAIGAPAAALPLAVRMVDAQPGFSLLAPAWERLHADAAVASIFNSWLWQYAWWDLYGGSRPLRILVAECGGDTVGILPLYLETVSALGLHVRMLRLLGSGGDTNPDDIGPLLARGYEEAAAGALADAMLRMEGFDVAQLSDMDARSSFPAAALRAAQKAQATCELSRSQRILYIDLPKGWNAFLESVSAHRRAHIRALRKRLAAAYATRFFVWTDAARLARAAEKLAYLHKKRWAGQSGSFASPEYNGLHLAAMRESLPADRLRLYCLEIAGELAAIIYCYRFRNRIYVMQAGFDPAYSRWSPGTVLLSYALEHAIGEGNEVLDFLRGQHGYKEDLATGSRQTVCLTVSRSTLGAAAYRASRVYLAKTKAKVKALAKSWTPR